MGMNSKLILSNKDQVLQTATTVTAGSTFKLPHLYATFQATLDAASTTPAATVAIEVSNDNLTWIVMGTISVSGNSDTDGFASNAGWKYVRSNVTAISDGGGTGTVTVTMGG